jgi:hypothetical protein
MQRLMNSSQLTPLDDRCILLGMSSMQNAWFYFTDYTRGGKFCVPE